MKLIIQIFGVLMVFVGLFMFINPEIIYDWIEDNLANYSFYWFAIIFRLAMGGVFIIAAKESKYPGVMKVFGGIAI